LRANDLCRGCNDAEHDDREIPRDRE
jgi:hypothetical protein